jgi:hypothetical protein
MVIYVQQSVCGVQFYALASALANAVTVDPLDKRINYSYKTDPYGSLRGNRNPKAELTVYIAFGTFHCNTI